MARICGAYLLSIRLVLDTIDVEGRIESAWGPADGIVATRSATGTKTDTPIIETPQAVSVVTREELDKRGAQTVSERLGKRSRRPLSRQPLRRSRQHRQGSRCNAGRCGVARGCNGTYA